MKLSLCFLIVLVTLSAVICKSEEDSSEVSEHDESNKSSEVSEAVDHSKEVEGTTISTVRRRRSRGTRVARVRRSRSPRAKKAVISREGNSSEVGITRRARRRRGAKAGESKKEKPKPTLTEQDEKSEKEIVTKSEEYGENEATSDWEAIDKEDLSNVGVPLNSKIVEELDERWKNETRSVEEKPRKERRKKPSKKKQLRAKLRREQFRANQTISDTGKKKKKNKMSRKMRMQLRQERLNSNKSMEDTGNRFDRFSKKGRYEERGARRYDNDRNRYWGRSRYGDDGRGRYRDRGDYRGGSRYGDRYGRRDRFDDSGGYDRGRNYGGGRWNDRYNKYGSDNYRSNYRDRYDNYRDRYRDDGYRDNYRNDRNSYRNDRNSYRDDRNSYRDDRNSYRGNYRDRYRSDNSYRDRQDGEKDFRLKYKGHDYYDSRFDRNREIKGPKGDENKYAKKGKRYDINLDDYVSDEAYKDKNKDSVKKEISSKESGKNEKNQNDKNEKNVKTRDDKNNRDKRASLNYDMSDERHDASLMQSSTSGKTLKYQRGQGGQRDANWRRAMKMNPYEQNHRYKREDKIQEDSKSEAPEVKSNSVRRRRRKRTRELVGLGPRKVNIKDFLYDKVMETGPQVEFEEEEWVEWLGNRRIGRVKFDVNGVTLEPITWDQKLMLDNWHNFQKINRERKKEMREIRERAKLKQLQESLTTENNEVKKFI